MKKVRRFPSITKTYNAEEFEHKVYTWLCGLTGDHLYYDYTTKGRVTTPLPSQEELAAWLDDTSRPTMRKHHMLVDYDEPGGRGVWDAEKHQRTLDRAAAYCLDMFDPQATYTRAVNGGSNSKRSISKAQMQQVVDLLAEGHSVPIVAGTIGISDRTVQRRHKAAVAAGITPNAPVIPPTEDPALIAALLME